MNREELLLQIRKEFGEDSIFILGQTERLNIEVRSSGSLMLDLALGGGYPKGRVVELSGKEGSGKTTLASLAIAEAQKNEPDKENAIIDLEHKYNPSWAKTLGVDVDKLFISQPDTSADKVYDMIEFLVRSGKFAYIVLDSVASLVPREELDEKSRYSDEVRVGALAKLNAKAMNKIVHSGLLSKSGTTLMFINQLRDKIGGFSLYGTPTQTPGGRSLKHSYTQRLEVSVGGYFEKGTGNSKIVLGQQTKVKVVKNGIAPPFRTATIDLYYKYGVDRIAELVNVAKEIGVLQGTNWLTFINPVTGEVFTDENGNALKWNGVAKAKEAIEQDIENEGGTLYKLLYDTVQELIRG